MKLFKAKIDSIKHPEKNPRRHPEKQIEALAKSISMFGQIRPVVIDENNEALAGNGLMEAMKKLGEKDVWAIKVTDLTDKQKKKLMLVDNRLYSLGIDDYQTQMEFLKDVIGDTMDFDIPGFDHDILETLVLGTREVESAMNNYGAGYEGEKPVSQIPIGRPVSDGEGGDAGEGASASAGQIICPHCGEIIWVT
jgi:hypothetical protein